MFWLYYCNWISNYSAFLTKIRHVQCNFRKPVGLKHGSLVAGHYFTFWKVTQNPQFG